MEKALSGFAKMATRKSVSSLSDMHKPKKEFPVGEENYELLEDCGRGVSATVHRAICKPLQQVCAVKKMNLESLNCDLDEIIHEAQTMKNYHHPNVLPLHCSFVTGQDLWMVMPYISGGSVLHIMKYAYPEGLDEASIATIMRDVLRALDYVHKQGGIHRDVKAGNILIDRDGHVHLGDFGVAASLERGGSWGHEKAARMTFVGTPCWMAPEVMEQTRGYDHTADIWSVGITLLEMAHGHAPFAKFPPMKVLLMTLQNPPPTLDDKGKKHFSKSMRDLVSRCLQKDPRCRPSAAQLLEHKFFKIARDDEFLAKNLMAGLPPLTARVQEIRQGKAATNAYDNDKNFALSQEEYKKGVSSWNFNVAALKQQAANEPNDPTMPTITEHEELKDPSFHHREDPSQHSRSHLQQQDPQNLALMPPALPQASESSQDAHGGWLLPQGLPTHAQLPHIHTPPETSGNIALQGAVLAAQQAEGNLQVVDPQGVVAAQPPNYVPVPCGKYDSVFASLQGQQQLLASTSQSAIPVPVHPVLEASDGGSGGGGDHEGKPLPGEGGERLMAGVDVLVSPGTVSPSVLSQEGITQGGPGNLALSTPNAAKQKIKQQGRFQVYEPGSDPPPMSPSNGSAMVVVPLAAIAPAILDTQQAEGGQVPVIMPTSTIPGPLAEQPVVHVRGDKLAQLEVGDTVFDENAAMEPKKKGRFLVMEQQASSSLQKSGSAANIGEKHHPHPHHPAPRLPSPASGTPAPSAAGAAPPSVDGVGAPMPAAAAPPALPSHGKPPPAPAAVPPVAAVLPKLQELVEHSAQHQAALLKLMAAVAEAEKGKPTALFGRTTSNRSLFADMAMLPYPGSSSATPHAGTPTHSLTTGGSPRTQSITMHSETGHSMESPQSLAAMAAAEDQRQVNEQLSRRLAALEAENNRLRTRNMQLEALSQQQQQHQQGPGSLSHLDPRRVQSPPAAAESPPHPDSHGSTSSRPGASPGTGSGGRGSPSISSPGSQQQPGNREQPGWDDGTGAAGETVPAAKPAARLSTNGRS